MNKYTTNSINIPLCEDLIDKTRIAKYIGCRASDILDVVLYRHSIDGRKKDNIHHVCRYIVAVSDGVKVNNCTPYVVPYDVLKGVTTPKVVLHTVVVGSGPAGLMCARLLSQYGHTVTIVERGKDISERVADVNSFFDGGQLDVNSNVQFGLGGAGTFSDGKLTTGTSSPLAHTLLCELVRAGAPSDIMYSNTPHIGTDRLRGVVANIRDSISVNGGRWLFDTTLVDIHIDNGIATGVVLRDNASGDTSLLECDNVVLAIGHSARDTFEMLQHIIHIEPKPFAVGVRIEHSRQFISQSQYGQLALTHRDLQSAPYKMAVNLPNGRNCYTFCMCPGGTVVPASSELDTIVVNGMSNYDRMAQHSNSALVVGVTVQDYYHGNVLDGVTFQRQLERDSYLIGNSGSSYCAPAQNVVDFVNKVASTHIDMDSSYPCGIVPTNLWDVLPSFVAESLHSGLLAFDKKIKGFASHGTLIAVESRTSSPVRLTRHKDTLASISSSNIYPIGEGAGYAGGIVSAGVDGLRIGCKIAGVDYQ